MKRWLKRVILAVSLLAPAMPGGALAEALVPPQPLAPPAAIAQPRDIAYPGTLRLEVDATDIVRRIFRVRQTIPVAAAGPMTLLFPKWIPGGHTPRGDADKMAGLVITANGQRLTWTRDVTEMSAFHVSVPEGVEALTLDFQYLSPVEGRVGRIVMTDEMLNLQWLAMAFYPAGYFTRGIPVAASVRLPADWHYGTALRGTARGDGWVDFRTVSFEMLMDSPVFAGRHFKKLDLDPGARVPVYLNVFADKPDDLTVSDAQLAIHRKMVTQTYKVFRSRHFAHYDFLLALSDRLGGIGLEHHQSSENGMAPDYFTGWAQSFPDRDLLPHEFVHSWNGKFRRPAELWTPDYHMPMRDSLLWVYEGQTEFWGWVLSARSGLIDRQQVIEAMATVAATYDARVGRQWRSLQDTTNDPILANRRPLSWRSWQRREDYYSEGMLLWLDVDQLIRERTGGRRSLDDFAAAFFGVHDGELGPMTYAFDDVVTTLSKVMPYDWAAFLRERLDSHERAPLGGIERGGYRLVFKDAPTAYFRVWESRRGVLDLTFSLGLVADKGGRLTEVSWDSPAFSAGLAAGVTLVAVNDMAYTAERLKAAVTAAAKPGAAPIRLLTKRDERYQTVEINYTGGLRYPHLERVAGKPALLDDLLAPRN